MCELAGAQAGEEGSVCFGTSLQAGQEGTGLPGEGFGCGTESKGNREPHPTRRAGAKNTEWE